MTRNKGLLQHHEPESWRFYVYGEDEDGEPLFSFWMNTGPNTGVCIDDRSGSNGMWLSTAHDDDEYGGQPPSEELKDALRDVMGTGGSIDAERVHSLPDHERYFFQAVHGTITQKGEAPDELLRFLSHVAGTEVTLAP